jgi:aquaporin Z
MKKLVAEFIGTFTLVLFGCGAAVIAGMGSGATSIDVLGISMAFGLAIVAMAHGIGPVSACHVNPAVSFGVIIVGRMSVCDFIGYAIAQILGALAGAAILYLVLSGKASGWTGGGGLGQNGWGTGYLGEYTMVSTLVFVAVATFIFLVCILGVTQEGAPTHMAGIAIGLTLVVIHIVGINFTGVSVNPARSIGPAIIGMSTNANAVSQLWLFIVAPLVGAGVAGLMFKSGLLAAKSE